MSTTPLLYETDSISVVPGPPIPGAYKGSITGTVTALIQTIDNRPALNQSVEAPGAPQTQSIIKNPA
jgi:hypothetical protein